jgi:hypothetical protein
MKFNKQSVGERAMESLLNAYVQCGGDPETLVQELTQEKPAPMKDDEADFFKKLEDQMGQP